MSRAKTFGDFAASYQGSFTIQPAGFDLDSFETIGKVISRKVSEFCLRG